MKFCFTLILAALLFANCQNSTQSPKNIEPSKTTQKVHYARPTFLSTSTVDNLETPHSVLSFAYAEQIVKIDSNLTGQFALMEPSALKQLGLSESCIAGGTAFWAGLQTTYIIDSTANGYEVKRKYQDEGGTKEKFKTVKVFSK